MFCTYPTMKRQRGRMGTELFTKILNDAQEMAPFIDRVSLQGLGEPLMDKDIVQRVYQVRQALPDVDISIYTNGSLLTPDMTARLKGAGLNLLVVSLTGVNREQRLAAMGLDDFERAVENADTATRMMPTKVKLVYSRDLVDPGHDQEFLRRWGDNSMITYEGNWAGDSFKFRGAPHTKACGRALDQIMVLWDGTLCLCCFDGEGTVNFGNVGDTSLRKLWEHPERQRIRQLHLEGRRTEVPICRGCTGI